MDKAMKLSIIAGVVIISAAVSYYFVVFLPQKEERKMGQEEDTRTMQRTRNYLQQAALEDCLKKADDYYWDYVKLNGTETKTAYQMPQQNWDYIDNKTQEAKELCLKQYPNK